MRRHPACGIPPRTGTLAAWHGALGEARRDRGTNAGERGLCSSFAVPLVIRLATFDTGLGIATTLPMLEAQLEAYIASGGKDPIEPHTGATIHHFQ